MKHRFLKLVYDIIVATIGSTGAAAIIMIAEAAYHWSLGG